MKALCPLFSRSGGPVFRRSLRLQMDSVYQEFVLAISKARQGSCDRLPIYTAPMHMLAVTAARFLTIKRAETHPLYP